MYPSKERKDKVKYKYALAQKFCRNIIVDDEYPRDTIIM
jgi:hypothetical protein